MAMTSLRRTTRSFLFNRLATLQNPSTLCSRFASSAHNEDSITRGWLSQLWLEEKRKISARRERKRPSSIPSDQSSEIGSVNALFQMPFVQSVFSRSVTAEEERGTIAAEKFQVGQFDVGGVLAPDSPVAVKLAPLLARSNLLITRDIEWANIMFAIEQESRYAIMDASYPQAPVGYIHEKSNLIFRQLLRTRRPFIAEIIDAAGNEIFRIRRPIWFINSSIYAEVDGKEIGVVHRRWHLWKRIYDLYLGNKQFAVVENPGFWNWTFTLKDENDDVLAQIDRDWRGVGFELFTDAGQYAIRFGDSDPSPKSGLASAIEQLQVARPLSLPERAVALALAVSLDSDYFSRRGGWGLPFLIAAE